MKKIDAELLKELGYGSHWCGYMKGWICLENFGDTERDSVMWTTDKDSSNRYFGQAVQIILNREDWSEVLYVYSQALRMWPEDKEKWNSRIGDMNLSIHRAVNYKRCENCWDKIKFFLGFEISKKGE